MEDKKVREKFGKAWKVTIRKDPGLKSIEMLDECVKGTFKAIFILGEDPAQTDPDLHHVRKALEAVDFLVVQELFHTETRAQLQDEQLVTRLSFYRIQRTC